MVEYRQCYSFIIKTRIGAVIRTYEDEWLTDRELTLFVKGMIKGLQCRVKYPYIEVYRTINERGEKEYVRTEIAN